MNWDDLRFFLAVSREETLTAAARTLGVSHTTVSRRVSAFEEQLATRLFERLPDRFVLTEAGEELQVAAIRMEEEVLGMQRYLSGRDCSLAGPIRFSTPPLALTGWLLPHLHAFSERHPEVELQIVGSGKVMSLARRELDVAIRFTENPPEEAIGRRFPKVQVAPYVAKSYLEQSGVAAGKEPLSSLRWIGIDPPDRDYDLEFLAKYLPDMRISWRMSESSLVYDAMRAGFGISRLPCLIGEFDPSLVRLKQFPIEARIDMWLLTHRDIRNTARVRTFIDFMTQRIEEDIAKLADLLG